MTTRTTGGTATFTLHGLVHYVADGRVVHADVALEECGAGCPRVYRHGDRLTIAYAPKSVTYAVMPQAARGAGFPSTGVLAFLIVSGLFGVTFVTAGLINMRWP